ncbi:MAG: metallophosphoesterase family protein, partial [Beijerinckiaceae bacterium]
IPTAPLLASGELGSVQTIALGRALKDAGKQGLVRVIMIHHPPTDTGTTFGRGLRDAKAFETCVRENGAELVIHGHNHKQSVVRIKGPEHDAVVVGVASASAVPGSANHRAAYHLYRIGRRDGRVFIEMQVRGLLPGGAIGDVSRQTLF